MLTALPERLGGLTSLQSLTLERREELEMLPDGTRHLTGLKQLTISDCPILAPRCLRETGEEWHKIAHIPNLQIERLSQSVYFHPLAHSFFLLNMQY